MSDELKQMGFPSGIAVKNPPANAGDAGVTGSILESRRSPVGGSGNQPHYSCLENTMDRGAWRDTVHRVTKSQEWDMTEATEHAGMHWVFLIAARGLFL